jgi:hypothetical protein
MQEPYKQADLDAALAVTSLKEAYDREPMLAFVREMSKEFLDNDLAAIELERVQALIKVDERFHQLLAHEQLDFLRAMLMLDGDIEFAQGVQVLALELTRTFQRYIKTRVTWNISRTTENILIRAIGLAINNLHTVLKWGQFLHDESSQAPLTQVHALYALAEADGWSLIPFAIRQSQPNQRFTIQALYVRLVLLQLINSGNLGKSQIEIADGWLGEWCREYRVERQFVRDQQLFYVDLAKDHGLRVLAEPVQGDSVRYVRVDAIKAQLDDVQTGLRHGRLFAGYGIGNAFPVADHVVVFNHFERLFLSIVSGGRNRVDARKEYEDREVDVIVGLQQLLAHLGRAERGSQSDSAGLSLVPAEGEDDSDASIEEDVYQWRLQDVSSNGYGLIVDRQTSETVMLNSLLALRNQASLKAGFSGSPWLICNTVRKLVRKERGILVGLQLLSYTPHFVRLYPLRGGITVSGKLEKLPTVLRALYLPGHDRRGKQDSIIIGANDFTAAYPFGIKIGTTRYIIRFNRIINRGSDWLQARFEIEGKRENVTS